ncbi:MAG TPA: fructosamine kinase family protein [Candidatus Jeotgalicoccus stercoravium]|nr:fructosamine kinase family protein [Candidatus Jeotgalicoccus stercoravium]
MDKNWIEQLPLEGIQEVTPMAGGDVNDAYKVEAVENTYFLLVQPSKSREFYDAEISGLKHFEEIGINAPRVIDSGEIDGDAYLLLSFIQEGSGGQEALGQMVAKMHLDHQKDGEFGYDYRHEGGDMTFDNSWTDSWIDLFVTNRLDVLANLVVDRGYWTSSYLELYKEVRQVIVDTLSQHDSKPSFLHGDLWAGNYMYDENGQPVLFDPSPFYGDREFDLGATTVFGGFTNDFYQAYDAVYPLTNGAWDRIKFYKFYLLFVHLAKFGNSYKRSVDEVMNDILA